MSDPISAAGSLTASISFSTGCALQLKYILHDLRHAPDEILALSNEVNDLQVILAHVETTRRRVKTIADSVREYENFRKALAACLERAKLTLEQLNGLVSRLLAVSQDESSNRSGVTALQAAACVNHARNAAHLLKLGADPEIRDINGDTPLFEAVRYDCKETLEALLRHNVRYDHVKRLGFTVLHIAALYSSAGTTDILAAARISDVSVLARDLKGRTMREVFRNKVGFSGGIQSEFERLLNSVDIGETADEDGEVEAFVDALEDIVLVNAWLSFCTLYLCPEF